MVKNIVYLIIGATLMFAYLEVNQLKQRVTAIEQLIINSQNQQRQAVQQRPTPQVKENL